MATEDLPDDQTHPLVGRPNGWEPDAHPPDRLSEDLTNLVLQRRDGYLGPFRFNQLGDHLIHADAFTRLAEPHLPPVLQRDARILRHLIDVELRDTLAVCILSIEDVTGGPPFDENQQKYRLSPEQSTNIWHSYFTSHFSDILCDTQFWFIVDELRKDVGLDAPDIA